MLAHQPLPSGRRELGQLAAQAVEPARVDHDRRQIGLGEVAVILRVFLAALAERALLGLRPAARLLHDLVALLQGLDLAADLVLDASVQRAKGVEVLELGLDAQLLVTAAAHRDVGLDAQLTFLHVGL